MSEQNSNNSKRETETEWLAHWPDEPCVGANEVGGTNRREQTSRELPRVREDESRRRRKRETDEENERETV